MLQHTSSLGHPWQNQHTIGRLRDIPGYHYTTRHPWSVLEQPNSERHQQDLCWQNQRTAERPSDVHEQYSCRRCPRGFQRQQYFKGRLLDDHRWNYFARCLWDFNRRSNLEDVCETLFCWTQNFPNDPRTASSRRKILRNVCEASTDKNIKMNAFETSIGKFILTDLSTDKKSPTENVPDTSTDTGEHFMFPLKSAKESDKNTNFIPLPTTMTVRRKRLMLFMLVELSDLTLNGPLDSGSLVSISSAKALQKLKTSEIAYLVAEAPPPPGFRLQVGKVDWKKNRKKFRRNNWK